MGTKRELVRNKAEGVGTRRELVENQGRIGWELGEK